MSILLTKKKLKGVAMMKLLANKDIFTLHSPYSGGRTWFGIIALVPLFFTAWLLGIPGGLFSTYLFEIVGVEYLALVGTRLFQMISYYLVFTLGAYFILGNRNIGLKKTDGMLKNFTIGLIIGAVGVGTSFLVMMSFGIMEIEVFAWNELRDINYFMIVFSHLVSNLSIAFIEEVPFRGYLAKVMQMEWGMTWVVLGSGLVFGLWHMPFIIMSGLDSALWVLLELIPLGLLLSWAFVKSGSLWLVIGIHASYNFMQQALDVYGRYEGLKSWNNLVVLGTSTNGSSLMVGTVEGSAGLMQLLSSMVVIVATWMYIRKTTMS